MKKNIALLLAGIMASSTVPVINVNASTNIINDDQENVYGGLVRAVNPSSAHTIEGGIIGNAVSAAKNTLLVDPNNTNFFSHGASGEEVNNSTDFDQWMKGNEYKIELKGNRGSSTESNNVNKLLTKLNYLKNNDDLFNLQKQLNDLKNALPKNPAQNPPNRQMKSGIYKIDTKDIKEKQVTGEELKKFLTKNVEDGMTTLDGVKINGNYKDDAQELMNKMEEYTNNAEDSIAAEIISDINDLIPKEIDGIDLVKNIDENKNYTLDQVKEIITSINKQVELINNNFLNNSNIDSLDLSTENNYKINFNQDKIKDIKDKVNSLVQKQLDNNISISNFSNSINAEDNKDQNNNINAEDNKDQKDNVKEEDNKNQNDNLMRSLPNENGNNSDKQKEDIQDMIDNILGEITCSGNSIEYAKNKGNNLSGIDNIDTITIDQIKEAPSQAPQPTQFITENTNINQIITNLNTIYKGIKDYLISDQEFTDAKTDIDGKGKFEYNQAYIDALVYISNNLNPLINSLQDKTNIISDEEATTNIDTFLSKSKINSLIDQKDKDGKNQPGYISELIKQIRGIYGDGDNEVINFILHLNNAEWYYEGFDNSSKVYTTGLDLEAGKGKEFYIAGSNNSTIPSKLVDYLNKMGLKNYTDYITDKNEVRRDTYIDLNQGYALIFNPAYSGRDDAMIFIFDRNPITHNPYAEGSGENAIGQQVTVPLQVRTTSEDSKAEVTLKDNGSNYTFDSNVSRTFSNPTKSGATNTYVKDIPTDRTNFKFDVTVAEQRVGALPSKGGFEIQAPSGYEFTNIKDIALEGQSTVSIPQNSDNIQIEYAGSNSHGYNIIRVTYKDLKQSTTSPGSLVLRDVQLTSTNNNIDTVSEKDLEATIRNISGNNSKKNKTVENQTFKVAYVRDWSIGLKTIKKVPTLVNGRLEGDTNYWGSNDRDHGNRITNNRNDYTDNIDDTEHKAATVKFEEKVENAWWARRTTKFILPEEVKIRKAEFRNVKNLDDDTVLTGSSFYNGQKTANVRISDNELTLNDIKTKSDRKGSNEHSARNDGLRVSFEMDLWLSIESGYTGDITLKLDNNDKDKNKESKVVIAKAVNPVDVKAKTTDVKIGYQYFNVGDFEIKETAAGRLKYGEELYISITDGVSSDMAIVPGYKWEVTEGDLKIKDVKNNNNLSLSRNRDNSPYVGFKIDRESSKASTIKFSNVQVKVDRTVPLSNTAAGGYEVVAWGPAVANNYEGLIDDKDSKKRYTTDDDYFKVPGISAKYVNVVTGADANTSAIKNSVQIISGSKTMKINGKEQTLEVAPYVSEASNSMMVPLRYVAYALGLSEDKVKWDAETSTVTVDAGGRIVQMRTNDNIMKINGSDVPMLSPDGLKVNVEVKEDRAFVPFRALGEAFNIKVDWDATTATATYNAGNSIESESSTLPSTTAPTVAVTPAPVAPTTTVTPVAPNTTVNTNK